MKECHKCKIEKPFNEFHKCKRHKDGCQYYCKICDNALRKKNYYINHEEEKDIRKNRYIKNKIRYNKQSAKYQRQKYKTNPGYNIRMRLSSRIRDALRYVNVTKRNRTVDYLGIDIPEFKIHLEKQFYVNSKTGEMMSWKNMPKWHIDHIIPCYSYDLTNVDAQKQCFNYKNLRPMWAEENLKKGNKFII
jgi:hypothetical protein